MAATSAAQEEAAYIASEFIYSIDNLPSEVAHLLQEIQHRETRCQELQREIDKDSNRYIRHSLRLSPSSSSSNSSSSGSPFSKLGVIPGKISAAYSEIQELSNEKQELAQRLVSLIEQTRTRLDVELSKVRALQGEPLDFPGMPKPLVGVYSGLDATKMPALAMTESLKAALAGTPITDPRYSSPQPATPVATTPNVPSHKRRKVTASASTPSIKVPAGAWGQKRSASPTVQSAVSTTGNQRSRLSRQIHPPTPDAEDDMEPEGDVEEEGDDDRAYCYCQKKSFGEMIACDNDDCPYEWFHYSCVGIKAGAPLPQNFFCDDCKAKLQKAEKEPALTRKGRRK